MAAAKVTDYGSANFMNAVATAAVLQFMLS